MTQPRWPPLRARIGSFEVDLESGELSGNGGRVRLQGQSLELLKALLERPGTMVAREELRRRLWPHDTFVDFDHGLNAAVRRLREALGDSADAPRFVETIPRKGYRLIASTDAGASTAVTPTRTGEAPVEESDGNGGHPFSLERGGVTVADANREMVDSEADEIVSNSASRKSAVPSVPGRFALVGVVGLVVGAAAVLGFRNDRATATDTAVPLLRFQEQWWGRPSEPPSFSISPDGRHLVMGAEGSDGVTRLWVRTLREPKPRPVPGTESAFVVPPFWSHDSSFLAWAVGGPLKKVLLSGGTPQDVCHVSPNGVGGSWNRDDVILSGNPHGGLLRCSASGGSASPVTHTTEPSEVHLFPSFLPDGHRFIYLRIYRQTPARSGLYVSDLNAASPDRETYLMATGFNASHVPAPDGGPGALVFLRDGVLYAQRFDDRTAKLRGAAVPLADRVGTYLDYAYFSASPDVLVYRDPDPLFQLTWFDRGGRVVARVGRPEPVAGLAVSPDDSAALVARHTPQNVVDQDLWLFDLNRETNPRKLTFSATLEAWPVWLTNKRFIYGSGGGETGVYQQTVEGQRQLLFKDRIDFPTSATLDGRVIVFTTAVDATMRADVWVWTEKGAPTGVSLITREGDQTQAQVSPDRHWIAYVSNETGRNEVFVAAFRFDESTGKAAVGDSTPVSSGGGFAPRWRGDGKELFYLTIDGSVMAVDLHTSAPAAAGSAKQLFTVPGVFPEWGVTRDGSRLLFAVPTAPTPPLNIIYNWQSALPQ